MRRCRRIATEMPGLGVDPPLAGPRTARPPGLTDMIPHVVDRTSSGFPDRSGIGLRLTMDCVMFSNGGRSGARQSPNPLKTPPLG